MPPALLLTRLGLTSYPTRKEQVFHIPERQRVADVHHDH